MPMLAALHDLRADLDLPAPTPDAGGAAPADAPLLAAIEAASAAFEQHSGRRFEPHFGVRGHALPRGRTVLTLDDDLLALTALYDAAGPIPLEAVSLWPPEPPHSLLFLRDGRAFAGDGTPTPVRLTGWWGWHPDWAHAFRPTGDALRTAPQLAFDAATALVDDADGFDGGPAVTGSEPRFPVGALLRLGSGDTAEMARVRGQNAAANTLTLERGAAGTTAQNQPAYTDIARYVPPRMVSAAVRAWAAALVAEAGYGVPRAPLDAVHEAIAAVRRVRV